MSVPLDLAFEPATAHAVIRPEPIAFISYPYEWSFGQLRDAAFLTLDAQAQAMEAGFTLRDASAYNVQFQDGRPVLIDTLSFQRAEPEAPWAAYRQFCEHFLAPLALIAHRDPRCRLMLRANLDGIPLDLAARLLPGRTRFNLGLGPHIHAHARAQRQYADQPDVDRRFDGPHEPAQAGGPARQPAAHDRRTALGADRHRVGGLRRPHQLQRRRPRSAKDDLVRGMLESAGGSVVWDLGANTGRFSRIAASLGRRVVAWDIDPAATEIHYRTVRREATTTILPLLGDIAQPSPALGWALAERTSMLDRADADVVLALALVHHLAIGRNVPLDRIADLFARLGTEPRRRIRPARGRDGQATAREPRGRLRRLQRGWLPGGVRAPVRHPGRTAAIEGTSRTLFRMRATSLMRLPPIYPVAIAVGYVLAVFASGASPSTDLVRPLVVAIRRRVADPGASPRSCSATVTVGALVAAVVIAAVPALPFVFVALAALLAFLDHPGSGSPGPAVAWPGPRPGDRRPAS